LQVMAAQGFTQAAVVGEIVPGEPGVEIAVG
jgi:hypothetical protein